MRILMMHSRYQQRGGEDISTRAEAELLRRGGHEVELVEYDNAEIDQIGRAATAMRTVWSRPAVADVRRRLAGNKFDVLHVQNYFPLISPAVLIAASQLGVATVQSLRNYRLMCAAGQLSREGLDCHICVGKVAPWTGVRLGCYRGSVAGSAVLATMIVTHKLLRTWRRHTDVLMPVSEFVRSMYVRGGFPAERMIVKPNVSLAEARSVPKRRQAIFAGRLTREKGVDNLINAWRRASPVDSRLLIVGTGPHEKALQALAEKDESIHFTGHCDHEGLMDMVAQSRIAIIPSIWDEPFGRTAIEAFSVGTPVLASARGGLIEIVNGTGGGATYEALDVEALANLINRSFSDEAWWSTAATAAKEGFASKYSQSSILAQTEAIYGAAIARRADHG